MGVILEIQFSSSTWEVTQERDCRRKYLQPFTEVSLQVCIEIYEADSSPEGDFSYDATQRACYTNIPKLPSDYSCPVDDDSMVLFSNFERHQTLLGSPSKISLTGKATYKNMLLKSLLTTHRKYLFVHF